MDWSLGLSMSLSKYLDQLGLNGFSLPNLFLRNFGLLFDVDTPCSLSFQIATSSTFLSPCRLSRRVYTSASRTLSLASKP